MLAKLDEQFEFGFGDECVVAPVLYGGVHGDSIVGVLGGRVWT